jgi:hypothetical protein
MLRAISILLVATILPLSLCAQGSAPTVAKQGTAPAASLKAADDLNGAQVSSTIAGSEATSPGALAQQSTSPSQQKPKPSKPKPKPDLDRPPIEGSMVGYVDNAIVGSQVRIRFDAAFHNNAPDRAEFFYARYNGLNNGPGPQSVVADLNFQQLYMRAEYAPAKRFSFFAEVPVRWIQPQLTVANVENLVPAANVNSAGLSDLAAGFKLAAVASSNQYLTFQFQAYFPSGNASTGLGTNHYSVEPAVLYYRRLSDRVALEAQVGDSHPIGGSSCPEPCNTTEVGGPNSQGFAGDVFFYGVGPSYVLYRGESVRIAPVIELVGWRVLGGLQTNCVPSVLDCLNQEGASADGTNIMNLKVGARTTVGTHSSFYIGYGHQLTHAVWYKEIVRAEYRYSF